MSREREPLIFLTQTSKQKLVFESSKGYSINKRGPSDFKFYSLVFHPMLFLQEMFSYSKGSPPDRKFFV